MSDRNKLLLIIAIIAVVLLGSSYLYHKLTNDSKTAPTKTESTADEQTADQSDSDKVPYMNFTVYDKDHQKVTLSQFIGKPVVLNFWASWCGPCQSEMPDFEEVYQTYSDKINFVMINLTDGSRETVTTATAFLKKNHYNFPAFFDKDLAASSTYYVSSIPQTFFIDKDGMIVSYTKGALSKKELINQIKGLLN